MRFELLRDPEQFVARAWPLLSGRIELNVLATVTMNVLDRFHPGTLYGLDNAGVLVWEDPEPASMVGITRPVTGIVRIGPVYTPAPLRRRGYAATAVAQVSRRARAGGARICVLYTDLSNPTSNKIYAEVGYRRRGNWEEHEFLRA